MANIRKPREPKQPRSLGSGISELLRNLGNILGDAYADEAPAAAITGLEAAKDALLNARKSATTAAKG